MVATLLDSPNQVKKSRPSLIPSRSSSSSSVGVVDGSILRVNSSRSAVLSQEQYESIKTLLQKNKEVAHHPEVKKQVRLVHRLLQKVSNRFLATNVCSENIEIDVVEDPFLSLVDDLIQSNFIEISEKEVCSDPKNSEFPEEKAYSDASSSDMVVMATQGPVQVQHDEVVATASESIALENESSHISSQEESNAGAFFCSLLPLCFPHSQEKDGSDAGVDNAELREPQAPAVTAPAGLIFRVDEALLDTRDDTEVSSLSACLPGRSCQAREEALAFSLESDPSTGDDEDDTDEDLQIRLGRGGPYDNLMRILWNLEMVQKDKTVAEVFHSPQFTHSSSHGDRHQTLTEV